MPARHPRGSKYPTIVLVIIVQVLGKYMIIRSLDPYLGHVLKFRTTSFLQGMLASFPFFHSLLARGEREKGQGFPV